MRMKFTLGVAALALGLLTGAASADEYMYCQQNGRVFFAVSKPDNGMVYADAGRCTGGPWAVWLKLVPASDTATAETDWVHDADAGRAYAVLGKVRQHSVHWLKAPDDVVTAFKAADVKATLAVRADHLPAHVAEQVWPGAPQ